MQCDSGSEQKCSKDCKQQQKCKQVRNGVREQVSNQPVKPFTPQPLRWVTPTLVVTGVRVANPGTSCLTSTDAGLGGSKAWAAGVSQVWLGPLSAAPVSGTSVSLTGHTWVVASGRAWQTSVVGAGSGRSP
jgi:hypothetical protein